MDKLTFYFDRNFGRRLPEALFRANPPFDIEFHHSPKCRFSQTTTDDEWLSIIGPKGWIAFSHDRKWHNELPALAAIKQHAIGCFYIWGAETNTWEKIKFFVKYADRIVEAARATPRPFVFNVTKTGAFERIDLDQTDKAAIQPTAAVQQVRSGRPRPRGR